MSDSKWKPQLHDSKVIVKNHYSVLLSPSLSLSLTHTHTHTHTHTNTHTHNTLTHFLLCAQVSVNLLRRRKWRSQEKEKEQRYHINPREGDRARMEWMKMTFHFRCGVWLHFIIVVVVWLLSCVRLFATHETAAHQASLSISPRVFSNSCPLTQWCQPIISSSFIPFSSCPQSFQHHGAFPWVSSSHQVAKSFGASALAEWKMDYQWIIRVDFL